MVTTALYIGLYAIRCVGWRQKLVKLLENRPHSIGHYLDHGEHTYLLSKEISEIEGGDDDVLFAASYLHDSARPQVDPADSDLHQIIIAEEAPEILEPLGFPMEKIRDVQQALISHETYIDNPLTRAPQKYINDFILSDADRLDTLGERTTRVLEYGGDKRPVFDPENPKRYELWTIGVGFGEDSLQVMESYVIRYDNGTLLTTETAKKMAVDKIAYMKGVIEGIKTYGKKFNYTETDFDALLCPEQQTVYDEISLSINDQNNPFSSETEINEYNRGLIYGLKLWETEIVC